MQRPRGNPQVRNVMFTVFAEGEDDLLDLDPELWPHCSFAIWQRELCPETNREHFQGYMELVQPTRYVTMHSWSGLETAHFEARRGNQQQAIDYCSKEDSRIEGPYEFGIRNQQGRRSDLQAIQVLLNEGADMRTVAQNHFGDFVRYGRGFALYQRLLAPRRNWAMELIFIIGPSGTGKTRQAWDLAGPEAYDKNKTHWWDGYDGQHTVIWDEFYGHCCAFTELLQIIDRYPYSVNQKGATVNFTSRRIIFTSNQEPEDWYDADRTHSGPWETSPLNRRIREFGRIIRTGEVHRRQPPVIILE